MKYKNYILPIFILFSISLSQVKGNLTKRTLISADNICTFHIADRLFSLIYLQGNDPYKIDISAN